MRNMVSICMASRYLKRFNGPSFFLGQLNWITLMIYIHDIVMLPFVWHFQIIQCISFYVITHYCNRILSTISTLCTCNVWFLSAVVAGCKRSLENNSKILQSISSFFESSRLRILTPGMAKVTNNTRLNQVPVIHVRGTNYTIGFAIGRQCKNLIEDVLGKWKFFNEVVIEKFLTPEGKQIYDGCLTLCSSKFPSYVDELKGMAEGSGIPFYKLFLLHIDSLIVPPELEDEYGKQMAGTGCTTVMCNSDEVIIGHTEDACPEFLNNVFLVSAQVLNDKGELVEKFTTLTYAGYLPGYTMGYNHHGLIYTVNTIFPKVTLPDRTPRNFLARAILKASNLYEALDILRDAGDGAADGFSVNLHFAKQEGAPVLHNVEVGPNNGIINESELSVLNLLHGQHHVHCNKYLRLKIKELTGVGMDSSTHRHKAIGRHMPPTNMDQVKNILSDQSDADYPVFRCGNKQDYVKTVAVGVFDVANKKWYIYMEPPSNSEPVAILPLDI